MTEQEELLKKVKDEAEAAFDSFKQRTIDKTTFDAKLGELNERIAKIDISGLKAELETERANTLRELENLKGMIESRGGSNIEQKQEDHPLYRFWQEIGEKRDGKRDRVSISNAQFKAEFLKRANTDPVKTGSVTQTAAKWPAPDYESGYTDLWKQDVWVMDLARIVPLRSPNYAYCEKVAVEGTAAMTAEGTPKAQISMTYQTVAGSVKKVTDWMKVSEEALMDFDLFLSEIQSELVYQIKLKIESELMTGDGTGLHLNGVYAKASAYTWAGANAKVFKPNTLDVIRAMAGQIRDVTKKQAQANVCLMNEVDFFEMTSSKDTNALYVIPSFISQTGETIGNIRVISTPSMEAGKILVGDFRYFVVRPYEALRVEQGFDGNDFTENMVSIRAEQRLISYIKTEHCKAFVKGDIATIKAAINKPTT